MIERQLSDMNPTSQITQSPAIHSSLNPVASRDVPGRSSETSQGPTVVE
jgi:hypothetical protein